MESVGKIPRDTNVEEIHYSQGLIKYVGKFLPGLSTLLHPVTNILKKENAWVWWEL